MLGGTTDTNATNSLAIGEGATTTLSDSIALGSGAVADRAKYDESNNKYTAYLGDETGETKKDSAWRSTANAIAIGSDDSSNPVTRQIIGVAAGTEDTDAVNVAQLKAASTALTSGGLKFGANANADTAATSAVVTNALGSTVNVVGEEAASNHTYSESNITTEISQDSDGNSTITVKFDKNPSFSSVIVGDTTVGNGTVSLGSDTEGSITELTTDSLKVGGKTYISSEGLNANGKINGVVAGEADSEAVNVGQLNEATADIKGITRSGDETAGYTTTIEDKLSVSSNGAFSISGDKFTVNSDGAISAAGGKFAVGAEGTLSAGATTVSDLTVGTKDRTTELTTEGVVADGDAGAG